MIPAVKAFVRLGRGHCSHQFTGIDRFARQQRRLGEVIGVKSRTEVGTTAAGSGTGVVVETVGLWWGVRGFRLIHLNATWMM